VVYPEFEIEPLSVSTNGSAIAYWADSPAQGNGWFAAYRNGKSSIAPQLTSNFPQTVAITGDGSSIFYTATMTAAALNYPGVYEWQLP
jgi:hypothetical protein